MSPMPLHSLPMPTLSYLSIYSSLLPFVPLFNAPSLLRVMRISILMTLPILVLLLFLFLCIFHYYLLPCYLLVLFFTLFLIIYVSYYHLIFHYILFRVQFFFTSDFSSLISIRLIRGGRKKLCPRASGTSFPRSGRPLAIPNPSGPYQGVDKAFFVFSGKGQSLPGQQCLGNSHVLVFPV